MTIPRILLSLMTVAIIGLFPVTVLASEAPSEFLDLTGHWVGITAVIVFGFAYILVIAEESIQLRKSKPVIIAAGIIWALVAMVYAQHGDHHTAAQAVRHNLLEFVELFLFLLAAMTYINTMDDRGVFEALRAWLVSQGYSLRTIFWITGSLSFLISPIADNLTTALLMSNVAIAVGGSHRRFISIACINIVIAANAGGAFSPFGDITTLMVWQKGIETPQGLVDTASFFALFLPSLCNWLIPALILSFSVPKEMPEKLEEQAQLQEGAWVVIGLFILTIILAVCFHSFLYLPPVLGMMTGLGLLKIYGYMLKHRHYDFKYSEHPEVDPQGLGHEDLPRMSPQSSPFNIYKKLAGAEWDTLMFFYGVILCVGGLSTMGYMALISELMYTDLGATNANVLVGFLSAVIDNIPVMFAVLSMAPEMDLGQWLLVTLTAGVGGSLLSVGSAAGVAVMGQAQGIYTFFEHLKWTWAIMIGFIASIWLHFYINAELFSGPVP